MGCWGFKECNTDKYQIPLGNGVKTKTFKELQQIMTSDNLCNLRKNKC